MSLKKDVVVRKVTNLSEDLRVSIDSLGGLSDINDKDFIIIKPNLCDFRPSWEGGTTDPQIIKELIKLIRIDANPRIAIVESNHSIADAEEEFERLGYIELADELSIELINLSKEKMYEVQLDGNYFKVLKVPEALLKSTKIISVAKLKTHSQQRITCNMKNLFGLISAREKVKYHAFMNEVLFDLCNYYSPYLSIIDGIFGMEGFGPSIGDKKKVGIIICGKDIVATDAAAAKVMGFKPTSVPYLKYAEKHGLGSTRDINIIKNYDEDTKFNFVPFYSYGIYRLSFFIKRIGSGLEKFFNSASKFISLGSIGSIVLLRGFFVTSELGVLLRKHATMFLRGLFERIWILAMLKFKRLN
ncbi:Uncharacterised protein [uncultured archaeon]|nr:Uncharacterised protein [uncultured archaeon]